MHSETIATLLSNTPPFHALDDASIRTLSKKETIRYDKKEPLYLPSSPCDYLDVVLEGSVAIRYIEKSGESILIEAFESPTLLSANCLFSRKATHDMLVETLSETIVLHIPKETLLRHMQSHTEFLQEMMRFISERTGYLTRTIARLTAKTIRERILGFLAERYEKEKQRTISLPISKTALAEQLHTHRSSLTRELMKMRDEGLLEFTRDAITLKERGLQALRHAGH